MDKKGKRYRAFLNVLHKELIPAFGCTEPGAITYAAAKAKSLLSAIPESIVISVSGSMIKNAKSAVVPCTGGMRGIDVAAAVGVYIDDAGKGLEAVGEMQPELLPEVKRYLEEERITVKKMDSDALLDILLIAKAGKETVRVRIVDSHTNIVLLQKNDEILYEAAGESECEENAFDFSELTVANIYDFASNVDLEEVRDLIHRQIVYNWRIALEGIRNDWGANIGKTLFENGKDNVEIRAKAMAAAGSDARMSGCEMPVVINSGSGNQGITVSVPVIEFAKSFGVDDELLIRALVLSNLLAIHFKAGMGYLSAYCGAISAGCAAGAGIAFLLGADLRIIEQTISNALAIASGTICDGAKPSCAAKIAVAVEAGILGFNMIRKGQNFKNGEGIVGKDVESTIANVARLGREGMFETNNIILDMMTET